MVVGKILRNGLKNLKRNKMKNIHILPTDKPSRLRITSKGKLILSTISVGSKGETQNIYITSDEKFKQDEYITDGIEVIKASPKLVNAQGLVDRRNWKKIILTTDQDLIKDGVQAIEDEFLEWFVKNPSCEFVEVCKNPFYELISNYEYYKIIIPKEEPNQSDWEFEISSGYNGYRNKITSDWIYESEYFKIFNNPKQETLEESNQTTAIRFLEWYRRRGIIYQFHSYHIPMDDRKYLNSIQLFEIFKEENYEK
jgi:hypothetical protein